MPHNDLWFQELCRVKARKPHPPREAVSIASSSPINLFECPQCHETSLSLRSFPPVCIGGFPDPFERDFGRRAVLLDHIDRIAGYSRETGTMSAMSYHEVWLRNGKRP